VVLSEFTPYLLIMAVPRKDTDCINTYQQEEGCLIRLVNGLNYQNYANDLDQMFKLRRRVFHERLKWDVNVSGEYEIDSYDMLKPLYVLAMDDSGKHVVGSLRLLPSTGPNMLADTFYDLLPEGKVFRNPTIWESSRYCVDTELASQWCKQGVHQASAELLIALYEIGQMAGLSFVVSVIDLRMERILRKLQCAGERVGEPRKYGSVTAIAGHWEITDEALQQLRSASGIQDSVLENDFQFEKIAA
jgi:acyl homoserine lactone synthase